jgi:hypothetical protein
MSYAAFGVLPTGVPVTALLVESALGVGASGAACGWFCFFPCESVWWEEMALVGAYG